MAGVLKMMRSIVERKKMGLQNYKDSDFKQYWMPDSNCKECYECGDRFTTFRRRHHCRVCGQIFCWRCCNQGISGNLIGYAGDLRVCLYCYKMVSTCMQSFGSGSGSAEDCQPFHDVQASVNCQRPSDGSGTQLNITASGRRKSSVMGFREEDIAKAKPSKSTLDGFCCNIDYDGKVSLDDQASVLDRSGLASLFSQLVISVGQVQDSKENEKTLPSQYLRGWQIVEWLVNNSAVSASSEAMCIGQSFLDFHFLETESPYQAQIFNLDGLYKVKRAGTELHCVDSSSENQESMEPLWVKEIQPSDSCTGMDHSFSIDISDDITEAVADIYRNDSRSRIPSSSSSFYLDLDIRESRVKVSRPLHQHYKKSFTIPSNTAHNPGGKCASTSELCGGSYNHEVHDMLAENFLKAYNANFLAKNSSRSSQDSHGIQQLKDESEKKGAMALLNASYNNLENNLLRQLLENSMLPSSWCEVILPIVHRVTDTVHPDVRNDVDSMDIRQYVQFKKIPGGTKAECTIVQGVVFTKSVAHRKMEQNIIKPAILLLSSPIAYQRTENKLSSLDPLIMQEFEYLKNTIGKLTVCKPDVLLVEKSVSRVAQEMLLSFGITVALNVKPTVMERVARCTKAAIVSTVDAHLGKPQLGNCKEFKVKTYNISSGKTKTLMFLDGCPADLGCTILLRGGSANELRKVKQIVQFMLYVAYNWRLERSFLMDEFALPPHHASQTLLDTPEDEKSPNSCSKPNQCEKQNSEGSTGLCVNVSDVSIKLKTKGDDSGRRLTAKCIDDFSDPLHAYFLQLETDLVFPDSSVDLQVDNLPAVNTFRKLLDDVILCCSLNVKVSLPYLETEAGKQCPLRKFFPSEMYWSVHFQRERKTKTRILRTTQVSFDDECEREVCESHTQVSSFGNVEVHPHHLFVTFKFTDMPCKTADIYSLLADYRARGCTIQCLCPHKHSVKARDKKLNDNGCLLAEKAKFKQKENTGSTLMWERKIDALDPYNHQKLAVLFCSYSCASNNAPNYCVNPWVVKMDFYGTNDIPLGGFLEKYCFRSSYVCPSQSCDTPMTGHIRKFVHGTGCVRIILLEYSSGIQTADTDILMWSWCPKCKQASSVVPMSAETWSFSFAKYLELRFYASSYQRQATNDMCTHSLHHEHNQYFAHKQVVAMFEFCPITVWEVVLPPITISVQDEATSASSVVDQIKNIAVKGFEIYSTVLERLFAFKQQYTGSNCEDSLNGMISLQKVEMSAFREKIENIQLRLTSPTLENMQVQVSMLEIPEKHLSKEICSFMWRIEDQVTLLRYHIAEAVNSWNNRIQEFINARKKEEKQTSKLLVSARSSENEEIVTHLDCTSDNSPAFMECDRSSAGNNTFQAENPVRKVDSSTQAVNSLYTSSDCQAGRCSPDTTLHLLLKRQKVHNFLWLERSLSCESIPDVLQAEKVQPCLFRAFSAPTTLSYILEEPGASEDNFEEDRQSVSSSNSSYTYGAAPGIYAGLMVPEPEDNESYVVCHKDCCDKKHAGSHSLRGHERSKSEGHPVPVESSSKTFQDREESIKQERRERTERTVKTLLSQFLSSSDVAPIQSPFPPTYHIIRGKSEKELIPIVVFDDEPSSIIAYTLASTEYEQKLQELRINATSVLNPSQRDSQTSSPLPKRRQNTKPLNDNTAASETLFSQNSDSDLLDVAACSGSQETDKNGSKHGTKAANFHLEVQFNDSNARFYCRVYYAEQFRKLRCLIFEEGEERYVRSLAHCVPWTARGGKSGSTFCKTRDDRFILKQMQKLELQSFLDLAPAYFQYINKACLEQKPTLLAKIVGVYRIGYKNTVTNSASKMDLLVMENLFYGCNITKKYDLKGSVRNRLVNTSGVQEDDVVLLDENLLKVTCDNPLYIRPHSKTVLSLAIGNDTQFLANQSVMDYSLLVGMDEGKKELIVGIIDYIRTFTWDKKVEMLVKSSGILGGHGKMPTVVPPELYKLRFCEAMDGYFLWIPDRWTNLGRDMPL